MAAQLPDVALSTPVADTPLSAVPESGRRGRGALRSLGIWIPAGFLILIIAACFLWPLVYHMPPPVGGNILAANLPPLSPGHIFGTDPVGNDESCRGSSTADGSRSRSACSTTLIGLVIGGLLGTARRVPRRCDGRGDHHASSTCSSPSRRWCWPSRSPRASGRASCTRSGRSPSSASRSSPASPGPATLPLGEQTFMPAAGFRAPDAPRPDAPRRAEHPPPADDLRPARRGRRHHLGGGAQLPRPRRPRTRAELGQHDRPRLPER